MLKLLVCAAFSEDSGSDGRPCSRGSLELPAIALELELVLCGERWIDRMSLGLIGA